MKLTQAWENEKKNHLGDYGSINEHDLWCAFKAGWLAHSRNKDTINPPTKRR